MTPRLYIQLGRFGDCINLLPLLYLDAQSGKQSAMMISKEFASLLDGVSYVHPIVFDGHMWELERAVKEAEKVSSEVINCQLVGPYEAVKNVVTTRNGLEYRTVTDSFQKDAWMLAKRLPDWKLQPPLVFDRRSPEREAMLVNKLETMLAGDKPAERLNRSKKTRKIILVGVEGTSSPFPYKKLLIELLRLRFWRTHAVIDLAEFRAERIYDLLGLYEKASVLVASDSAPLHLAWADRKLPVVALINDRPSLWHGSAWRPTHICHIRYRDFPNRAVEMLEAIDGLGGFGCSFMPRHAWWGPRIVHTWSRYEETAENEARRAEAQASWRTQDIQRWVSCPIEVGSCGRDSKSALHDDARYPFVKDVIALGTRRAEDDDVIVFTRCDTCIDIPAKLLVESAPCFACRTIDGQYHPAVDMFASTKAWWREHQNDYPDMILGKDAHWHRVLKAFFKLHGAKELTFAVHRGASEALPIPKPDEPVRKRVEHNEKLATEWFTKHGLTGGVPLVTEQGRVVKLINRRSLFNFGYNPSIIRWQNRLLMAYRWHDDSTLRTVLAMAELDEQLNVTNNREISVDGNSIEDPRLFLRGNELWVSFVDSTWPNPNPKCVTKYGKLVEGNPWRVASVFQPDYGRNDMSAMEKNWIMWEQVGKLFCIHDAQHVIELDGPKVVAAHETEGPRWPWGAIKGGTSPIPHDGKLLRFFHSRLDNETIPVRHRYYLGAMLMEPEPPFKVVAVSKEPILRGSELDDLTDTEKHTAFHHKKNVVFPAGAVPDGDGWLVSIGINDSCCAIVRLKVEDLNL